MPRGPSPALLAMTVAADHIKGKQSAQDGSPEARGIVTGRRRQLLAAGSVSEAKRARTR
ncbi:hypothetical protein SAMN05444272_4452 [Roseibium suaedae]|uniref:Uncharacterized protein n=1 Tax=Roseibium suaedae TaxID=735517 RepID=A0A1M7PIZ4_9HYPH|nr:hypothetical protein SAMN05444272_4452 [Roseibium suaedae]